MNAGNLEALMMLYEPEACFAFRLDQIVKIILKWNTRIAERYMGKSNAKAYGERNSTEDVILVRVKPTKVIAEKDIAKWE
jgi:hypothetical protein